VPAQAGSFSSFGSGILGDVFDIATPYIQSFASDMLGDLNVGGIDLSSLIMDSVFSYGSFNLTGMGKSASKSVLGDLLSDVPYGSQISSVLTGMINSGFSPESLLNSKLLKSILGSFFGGSDKVPDSVVATVAGALSSGSSATHGSGISGTGSTTCLYSSTCRPDSNPYQSIYSAAMGDQGFPNPNEVRGQIHEKATSGQTLSDIYASNSSIGAFYAGNQSDRDINRATTETYLNKAGQTSQKEVATKTVEISEKIAEFVEKCAKDAKSSQELIRCNLITTSVNPALAAAQVNLQLQARQDDQFQKIQLGNISASMDAERRQRDVENAGLSMSAVKTIFTTPSKF
jgi:hypothetical protein